MCPVIEVVGLIIVSLQVLSMLKMTLNFEFDNNVNIIVSLPPGPAFVKFDIEFWPWAWQNITSGAKTGNDKREKCQKQRRSCSKVWDLDSLVQLVGQKDEEDEERHNEEAVSQGGVGRGSPMVRVNVRHPQEDPREDDGVEDADQGDAEHDPQGDEGDLPGPRNDTGNNS